MSWAKVWTQLPKVPDPESMTEPEQLSETQFPLSPSILTLNISYKLEEELKANYLTYLYPYEWQKRKLLLPKEATTA